MSNPLSPLITWIKANKLSSFLLAVVAFALIKNFTTMNGPLPVPVGMMPSATSEINLMAQDRSVQSSPMAMKAAAPVAGGITADYSVGNVADRMMSQSSYLAVHVKDVKAVAAQITDLAKTQGGWLVDSTVSAADTGSTDGTISIRVPTAKLADTLAQVRSLGIRVVNEHVIGTDITDEYQNTTAQLAILEETKTKLAAILASASKVQDMLEAQQQLLNIQQQIDSLQGRQKFLDQSAQQSLITVYLATDELALPITAPGEAWRPNLVFKEAVRSLVSWVYKVGNVAIWLVVFSPVWLAIGIGYWVWQKRQAKP